MSNTAKIENYQQYRDALKRIEALISEVTEDMPEEDPRKIEYRVLSNLVADYSDKHFDLNNLSISISNEEWNWVKHNAELSGETIEEYLQRCLELYISTSFRESLIHNA